MQTRFCALHAQPIKSVIVTEEWRSWLFHYICSSSRHRKKNETYHPQVVFQIKRWVPKKKTGKPHKQGSIPYIEKNAGLPNIFPETYLYNLYMDTLVLNPGERIYTWDSRVFLQLGLYSVFLKIWLNIDFYIAWGEGPACHPVGLPHILQWFPATGTNQWTSRCGSINCHKRWTNHCKQGSEGIFFGLK